MIPRMRTCLAVASFALAAGSAIAQETIEITDRATVRIETSMGTIVVELDAARAPLTVQSFLQFVVEDHYSGTIFHRIAAGFIAQGGGYLPDMTEKPVERTVPNESGNGLSNLRGTIALARAGDPHSGAAQFFFNLVDNSVALDPRPSRWGYAVFGKVIEGLDIMDRMGGVPTGAGLDSDEFDRDVPIEPIIIERIVLLRE
jgi:cyclophilin family peptidyl-prolyl cis-trans isomerase